VVDVKYQPHLGSVVHDSSYEAIRVSKEDFSLDDRLLLEKYGKGRYPIITGDKSMYKENPTGKGATAFIAVPDVAPEQLPDLQASLKGLLEQHTSRTLAGKCYELSIDGEHIIFDLDI
jgi:hypothetical protein